MRTLLRIAGMPLLGLLGIISVSYAPYAAAQECSKGCVSTYGYDNSRDNMNPNETYFKATTILSVNPQHTNSPDLNGIVYAQPLYVSQVSINGVTKNVLFVATEENYVYALDGDTIGNPPLWTTNLNTSSGDKAVPDANLPGPGPGCNNISPEVGITGTPVIDTDNNVLYVVSKHYNSSSNPTIFQRLNVLNLSNGTLAAPQFDIASHISGFTAVNENQRAGLALVSQGNTPGGPLVYVAWGSHCDSSLTGTGMAPYTGWAAAFHFLPGNPQGALTLSASFNDEASGGTQAGIWMSGAAPAVTTAPESPTIADVFLATGNGSFNGTNQYGQSVLRLHHDTSSLSVTGLYTPNAWSILNNPNPNCTLNMPPPYAAGTTRCSSGDFDLGSGSVILARPVGTGYLPPNDTYVVLAAGKEGVFYVLDPLNMTRTSADGTDPCTTGANGQTIECLGAIQLPLNCCVSREYGSRGSNAFWGGNGTYTENVLYVAGSQDPEVRGYQMAPSGDGSFTTSTLFGYASTPDFDTHGLARYPGSSPVISWNSGTGGLATDAILWVLVTSANGTGPAKLYAYSATPNSNGQFTQLWPDTTNGPWATKFMPPTVINGHV